MKTKIKNLFPHAIALLASIVFLDSLRYKFTDHPNTQVIFGKLSDWTTSLGLPDLFAHTGIFSQYIIGSAEAAAAAFLLVGIHPRFRAFQGIGALIAFGVMSGAVFFHLFTPLGIDPNNDGGGLFMMAVIVWMGSALLVFLRRKHLLKIYTSLVQKIKR